MSKSSSERELIRSLKEELEAKSQQCREYEEQIERYENQIQAFEQKIDHISVMNRWKIGEYLHDSLAQKLNYAKILLSFLKKDPTKAVAELEDQCNEVLRLLDEGIREVRDLSHDIIPVEIGREGCVKAFKYLQEQVENRHQILCELEIGEVVKGDMSEDVVSNLYLIAQEAIKNAVAHGEADIVRVALFRHEGELYMHVKDNGKGYKSSDKGGVGLDIMNYRAKEMEGRFRIRSVKEEDDEFSTYVTCTIPLSKIGG